MIDALLIGLIIAFVGQTGMMGALWRRVGKMEATIEKACPFGGCPFYKRAMDEAAPDREVVVKILPKIERATN